MGLGAAESIGHSLIDTGKIDGNKLATATLCGAVGGLIGGKGAIRGNEVISQQLTRFGAHIQSDGFRTAFRFLKKSMELLKTLY